MNRLTLVTAPLIGLALFLAYRASALAQEIAPPVDDLSDRTPFEAWQYLVGIFIPWVVAFVIQRNWPEETQRLAQLGVAVVVGVAGELIQNGADDLLTADPLVSIMKLLMVSQISYSTIWKAKGLQVPYRIEAATGGDPVNTNRGG